ncbi:MAG TPA: phage minor head protein [Phycisphaerae bacterium]|nr:phage minor head protein [Phycisphaerae bacterium]
MVAATHKARETTRSERAGRVARRMVAYLTRLFRVKVRKFFNAQERRVLSAFDRLAPNEFRRAYAARADWPTEDAAQWTLMDTGDSVVLVRARRPVRRVPIVPLIFDERGEAIAAHDALIGDITRAVSAGIDRGVNELAWDDSAFSVSDPKCADWLQNSKGVDYWQSSIAPNATTINNIHTELAEGMDAGESLPALRKRVESVFTDAKGWRSALIALTEIGGAYETGGHLTATAFTQETGAAVSKRWQSAEDAVARKSHRDAGSRNGWIDEEALFLVGDAQMKFPRDPAGPMKEIANCRCSAVRRVAQARAKPVEPEVPVQAPVAAPVAAPVVPVEQPVAATVPWAPAATLEEAEDWARQHSGVSRLNYEGGKQWGRPLRSDAARLEKLNVINGERARLLNTYPDMPKRVTDTLYVTSVRRAKGELGVQMRGPSMSVANAATPNHIRSVREWEATHGRKWGAERPETFMRDSYRHELAHNMGISQKDMWTFDTAMSRNEFRQRVSEYAGTNAHEAFAETFTMMTAPGYNKGTLPAEIEDVVYRRLGVK